MASMRTKKPWQVPGVPWKSESAFWIWVRGGLRKLWSRHPVKIEYIKKYRKQIKNPNLRGKKETVWGMTCSKCNKDHVQSEIEIDHISETGGTFTGLEDIKDYAAYLFLIDFDSIRAVCKGCHAAINLSQRNGISFEEATLQKRVTNFLKENSKETVIDFCQHKGYTAHMLTNAVKRKAAVESILREEQTNA